MNSFNYLLIDKSFSVKEQISEKERYNGSSPYQHFILITRLPCKYETTLFRGWVEKQHPENYQFKTHKLPCDSFPKINNKTKSTLTCNKKELVLMNL